MTFETTKNNPIDSRRGCGILATAGKERGIPESEGRTETEKENKPRFVVNGPDEVLREARHERLKSTKDSRL
jgi:hypothetical protein